jgi:glycosyltransferase involved in cell wall biosynthesis
VKIAIVSSTIPFVGGGARNIVDWLSDELIGRGHQVEKVLLPFSDEPADLFPQLAAFRAIDLTDAVDLAICIRPPAFYIKHPRKVVWFIHHLRTYYDLWESEFRLTPDTAISRARRDALHRADTAVLGEASRIFVNSAVVGDRLRTFNGLESTVLYPPLPEAYRASSEAAGDAITYVSRLDLTKRQHLLVDALALTTSGVRLVLAGKAAGGGYGTYLKEHAGNLGIADRVTVDDRWVSDDEKADLIARSLAVAYLPVDEDSYGYPSLEAARAQRPVLTTTDSGGVLELVQDGVNGRVVEPTPEALARAMDDLFLNRTQTAEMGRALERSTVDLGISWNTVIEGLLS